VLLVGRYILVDQDGVVAKSDVKVLQSSRVVGEGTEEVMAGAMVKTIVQAESTTAGTR
jgi:hypothetical protein